MRRRSLVLLVGLLLLSWALVAGLFLAPVGYGTGYTEVLDPNFMRISYFSRVTTSTGPFGTLRILPVTLQPPPRFFGAEFERYFRSSQTWNFAGGRLEDIERLLTDAGVDRDSVVRLLRSARPLENNGGYALNPPDDVLWRLTPGIRAKLYPRIGQYPDNPLYRFPFEFRSRDSDEWFFRSRLPTEIVEKLRSLVYESHNLHCISDAHLLLPLFERSVERLRVFRVLSRVNALTLFLKVEEGENIENMVRYWGNLGREELVETALESLRDQRGGGLLDVVHLLPPIARLRLNTYITPDEVADGVHRDCNWMMFNFFNTVADHRFNTCRDREGVLRRIADPLRDQEPRFGDIVLLLDDRNAVMHACIFIAGGIVYTKNGVGSDQPFILDTLANVQDVYSEWGARRVQILSRKVRETQPLPDLN